MRTGSYPNLYFEKKVWAKGFKYLAGADEVGRGCFAGPVVASAVALSPMTNFQLPITNKKGEKIIIDDSKKLTTRQRERAEKWIKQNALTWGVGLASVAEINRRGMGKATHSAFRRAIVGANKRLGSRVNYLLIDAFYIPYIRGIRMPGKNKKMKNKNAKKLKDFDFSGNQLAIINGDEKSVSIGAASIVAKVYRDKLMRGLSKKSSYKKYGWGRNKGYGTKEHRAAIKKYGITRLHRKKFVETFLSRT